MAEKRRDPADGRSYAWEEFLDYYEGRSYSQRAITRYWEMCIPAVKSSGAGNATEELKHGAKPPPQCDANVSAKLQVAAKWGVNAAGKEHAGGGGDGETGQASDIEPKFPGDFDEGLATLQTNKGAAEGRKCLGTEMWRAQNDWTNKAGVMVPEIKMQVVLLSGKEMTVSLESARFLLEHDGSLIVSSNILSQLALQVEAKWPLPSGQVYAFIKGEEDLRSAVSRLPKARLYDGDCITALVKEGALVEEGEEATATNLLLMRHDLDARARKKK